MFIKKEKESNFRIVYLTVFGIAMGFLEAAVVMYLRELYYPEGFSFPIKPMALEKLSIEYLREISTIVMLFSLSRVAGKNFTERLSFFLYSFGIWDIFYYMWLKVLLNWPSSLFTWDILFLIPVIWVGPVLAPIICSITLIATAGCILYIHKKGYSVKIGFPEGFFFIAGAVFIFITFIWDFSYMILKGKFISRFLTLAINPESLDIVSHYIPANYNWCLFALGEALMLLSLLLLCQRVKKHQVKNTAFRE